MSSCQTLKLNEQDVLSGLQEGIEKVERENRQQCRNYVSGIMDAVDKARRSEVGKLERQHLSAHLRATDLKEDDKLGAMVVASANLCSTRAAAKSLLDMVKVHS
jgi:hypothetical protein